MPSRPEPRQGDAPLLELRDVAFAYGIAGDRDGAAIRHGRSLAGGRARRDPGRHRPQQRGQDDAHPPGHASAAAAREARSFSTGAPWTTRVPGSWPARLPWSPRNCPPALRFTVEQLALMGRYPHAPARFFESGEDLRHRPGGDGRDGRARAGVAARRPPERRRAPARHAGAGARPGAGSPRAGRAHRAPRPAPPGGVRVPARAPEPGARDEHPARLPRPESGGPAL